MCGIVGYAGNRPAAPILLGALRDLEYRGYDSAGVALCRGDGGDIAVIKRAGKIANLESALAGTTDECTVGIGHTRWATHGSPTDHNAHPHRSYGGSVTVVHNGIVENYASLRAELQARGRTFASETDTETIAHLLEETMAAGHDLLTALRLVASRLDGSQAIVAVAAGEPGVVVGTRIGNAGGLVIGYGDGEMFFASDLAALLPHTRRVSYLADGEFASISAQGARVADAQGTPIAVEVREVSIDPVAALKGEYPSFMLKEIFEQPQALRDTVGSLVSVDPLALTFDDLGAAQVRLAGVRRVVLLGMGTSLHAAMLGRSYIERIALIPCEIDNASEFRYREPVLDGATLVVSVSQSGETVDVLEAMSVARKRGALQVTICNTPGAQTTRVADGTIYTRAGPERGVASTKCFTTQAAALYCLALGLGVANGRLSSEQLAQRVGDLARLPGLVARQLDRAEDYERASKQFAATNHMLFLGRGPGFPVAMEGALKMKEVSYVHAEGYAAGEMKHGPIALIDAECPVVAVTTSHALRPKMVSNIEQVQARGGVVLAIATEGDEEIRRLTSGNVLFVPEGPADLEPILATIPLQCLAYQTAIARGCDVDQPRNLAKTVTVE